MGHLSTKDTESPWVNIWKIRIWGLNESLEAGEDLLTPTKSPPQIPTNLKEVGKDVIGFELMR